MALSTDPFRRQPWRDGSTEHVSAVGNRRGIDDRRVAHVGGVRQAGQDGQQVQLSVVVPVFNERDSLQPLYAALRRELEPIGRSYEIIFVDDGSRDSSHLLLRELAASDPAVKLIRLRRNFGQTAAFSAGFHAARGDVVVTMDADLQNDPADIQLLLSKIDEGYDVVSGWRVKRQDAFITRRLPSIIANRVVSMVTGVHLHDYGCSLKAYRAEVVKEIHLYGEMHRFVPAIASQAGVTVTEVPVNHSARRYGRSKYGLGRTSRVLLDLLTVKFLLSFSTRPIHIFGMLGLASFLSGSVMALYLAVLRLVMLQSIGDRPLLMLAVLLIILGVQLIGLGLLGEFLARVYYEVQGKRTYSIRETAGYDE